MGHPHPLQLHRTVRGVLRHLTRIGRLHDSHPQRRKVVICSSNSHSIPSFFTDLLIFLSLIGRVFPPWAGDYLGRFNTAILFVAFGSILVLALWVPSALASSSAPTVIFAALFGLPLGCFAAILPALVAQITTDVRTIDVRLGATFFVTAWAGLTGQPIAGALVQRGAGLGRMEFVYLKVFCGVTIALGAGFLIAARISSRGWKLLERA